MAFGIDVKFEKDKSWEEIEKFFEKPDKRISDFKSQAMRDIVQKFSTRTRKRIPRAKYLDEYKRSIHAVETDKEGEMAVIADAERIAVRKLDPQTNVLNFLPKNPNFELSAYGRFLVRGGSFPLDMIRKVPIEVESFYKRVSSREVNVLAHKKSKLARKVYAFEKEKGLVQLKSVIPDLTFMALRTEFSLQGYAGGAHWRPSIKDIDPEKDLSNKTKTIFEKPTKGYKVKGLKGKINEKDLDKKFINKVTK